MSNTKFFNGFINEDSYKLYRYETESLQHLLNYVRAEEERNQIPYWLIHHYIDIDHSAKKMLGYIECLWDYHIINEDTIDSLYSAYSLLAREAEERIHELSEEK